MKRIIFLFLLFLPLATSGQVLYLKMDTSQPKQHSDSWELKNNKYYKIFAQMVVASSLRPTKLQASACLLRSNSMSS